MSDIVKTMQLSASGMAAQAARMRISSENLANADTPGYRRKLIPFENVYDRSIGADRVSTGQIALDQASLDERYEPTHPLADGDGYVTGSNVNMLMEIADSREAQRSYEANVRMFDQAKRMASSLIELLRR